MLVPSVSGDNPVIEVVVKPETASRNAASNDPQRSSARYMKADTIITPIKLSAESWKISFALNSWLNEVSRLPISPNRPKIRNEKKKT
jgi:hypothetical protein